MIHSGVRFIRVKCGERYPLLLYYITFVIRGQPAPRGFYLNYSNKSDILHISLFNFPSETQVLKYAVRQRLDSPRNYVCLRSGPDSLTPALGYDGQRATRDYLNAESPDYPVG